MKIYILMAGVKNNCESVRGVFSSMDKLEAVIKDVPHTYQRAEWERVSPIRWECRDEYLLVDEMDLDENIFTLLDKSFDQLVDQSPTPLADDFDAFIQ